MNKLDGIKNKKWLLLPIFGILIFATLYFLASLLYPGGSQADSQANGFSWINNYWCNLLNDTAINGQPNSAQPLAIAAMLVLCISLSFFWYLFPAYANADWKLKATIRVFGISSMAVAILLFIQPSHDLITNLASAMGVVAVIGTIIVLYKIKWMALYVFGLTNLVLVILNNFLYYTPGWLIYLPLIQKISFGCFLLWVYLVSFKAYNKA